MSHTNPSFQRITLGSGLGQRSGRPITVGAIRAELRAQGTCVIGVLPGFVDTAMIAGITAPKIQPSVVLRATLDALLTDQDEVYPGEQASQIAAWLRHDPTAIERLFAQPVEV